MVFDIWEQLIQFILSSVEWISSDQDLLLDELNLSIHTLCSYYLLALFLWWGGQHPWINKRKIITLYCPLLLSIISTGHIVQRLTAEDQEIQFALLHRYKHTVVIAKTKEGVLGFSNAPGQNSRLMRDYSKHNIQILTQERTLSSIMRFDQIPIIIIDSSGLYPQLSGGIVLLTKNANIHLEQLVHELKPRVILADGSNNQNVVQRWRKHAKEINQKFLDTYKFGAIETREPEFKNYL